MQEIEEKNPSLLKEGILIILKEGKTDGKWRTRDALILGGKKVLATCVHIISTANIYGQVMV